MIKKALIICSVCLLMGVAFTFMWQIADDSKMPDDPGYETGKGYGNVKSDIQSENNTVKQEESEKYFLVFDGENICAYVIKGDDKTLIKSTKFSAGLIDDGEISKLSDGIYARSYEELCLYLESYLS